MGFIGLKKIESNSLPNLFVLFIRKNPLGKNLLFQKLLLLQKL